MGRFFIVLLCLAVFAGLFAATPAAAVKYVKWNATGAQTGASWCDAYLTIQAALDVAADSEPVRVAGPHTYTENIIFKSGAILQGGYRGNCAGGPPDGTRDPAVYMTTIDGGAATAGTTTVTGFTAGTLDGFTVLGCEMGVKTNGMTTVSNNTISGAAQWGIRCTNNANILNNSVSSSYYGIYVINSSPVVTSNTLDGSGVGRIGLYCTADGYCYSCGSHCYTNSASISNNTIRNWVDNAVVCTVSGVSCYTCGGCTPVCNPVIASNTISDGMMTVYIANCAPSLVGNTVVGSDGGDAAIGIYNCSPYVGQNAISGYSKIGILCAATSSCYTCGSSCGTVIADLFENTISGTSESGIHCYSTRISCLNCGSCEANCKPIIRSNKIQSCGINGIVCRNARPSVTTNSIVNNSDCGIYAYNDISSTSMLLLTIDGNTVSGNARGIYSKGVSVTAKNNVIQWSRNEGVLCDTGSASVITDNEIYGGTIGVRAAGTVAVPTSPKILRNIITGQSLGGVLCQNSSSQVYSNVLARTGQYGVDCQGGSAQIYNNTIVKNAWYGIWVESAAAGFPQAYNNIVSGSPCGINVDSGTPTLGYNNFWNNGSDYCGTSKPASDISIAPLFLAAAVGEYHLLPGSPCIGAGDNTKVTAGDKDADGKDRILPAGGVVDMGCFEWEDPTVVPYWVRLAGQAKVVPSQYKIQMKSKAISARWTDSLYVEDYDSKAGIRVEKTAHGLTAANLRANLEGTVQANSDGEQSVVATTLTATTGYASVMPLAMNSKWIGGDRFVNPATGIGQSAMTGVRGLSDIGLLVKAYGLVTAVDPNATPTWFKINDGGRVIKCVAEGGNPVIDPSWFGKHAVVTGVSSCEYDGANLVSKIRLLPSATPDIY